MINVQIELRVVSLSLMLLVAACGGRTLGVVDDGSTRADPEAGLVPRDPDVGLTPDTPSPMCLIAIRVDTCCARAMPALAAHVAQDPCLVPYPPKAVPAQCKIKQGQFCSCAFPPDPLSRLVEAVPGGGCRWSDECASDSDCAPAVDIRRCCTCTEVFPRVLVQQSPCLLPFSQADQPAPLCPDRCPGSVICDGCFGPGTTPTPTCHQSASPGLPPPHLLKICTSSGP